MIKNIYQLVNLAKEKGFFHLLSSNFFINLVGFGSQFFVAWVLSPIQLGEIKIMQTYLAVFSIFSTFGFNSSVLKLCSENRTKDEKNFLFVKGLKYVSITIMLTFIISMFLIRYDFISKDDSIKNYLMYYCCALIPLTYSGVFVSFLQSNKEFKTLSRITIKTKVFSILFIILLTYSFSLHGYVLGFLISSIIGAVFFLMFTLKFRENILKNLISNPLNLHLKYSNVSFLANLLTQLTLFMDVILMNYFIDDKSEIGFYSFALTLLLICNLYTTTVQQISVPHLSEKSSYLSDLKIIYKKYKKLNLIGSFFIFVVVLGLFPYFIVFVFNGKYNNSISYFIILLISWLFQNFYVFEGYTLWGLGKIRQNFISQIFIFLFTLIFSLLFMKLYGIIGLAIGKLVSNFIGIFIVKYFFVKNFNI